MPGRRCNVAVCNNSMVKTKSNPLLQHVMYHSFPKDKELKKKWILLCRRKGKWKPEACRICSEHFKPDDYVRDLQAELLKIPPRKLLKKTAVPSLNLGLKESPKRLALAEKRLGRQERRTNKKLVDQLLKKKYDQDSSASFHYVNIASESNSKIGLCDTNIEQHKIEVEETCTVTLEEDRASLKQEQDSEEFIVEYLVETNDILMQDSVEVKPESNTTVALKTCKNCGPFKNLKNEHDLLQHQYNALANENRELSLKLEHSQESFQLCKSKLKEVLKELQTLKDSRAKEHMVVQSKCENGMYEVFVVMNNEGNK